MLNLTFNPFPVISTSRLFLRQLKVEDVNEVFTLRSDDRVNEFLHRPKAKSIEEVEKFIEKINAGIAKNETVYWALNFKDDPLQKVIGTIMLWNISPENSRGEIGFELHPDQQGKGIMQEAITAVLNFGFDTIKLLSIEGYVNPDNRKSIAILEKNNFRKEDRKAESSNDVIYTLFKPGAE